jgi:hypothetical protein
MAPGVSLPTASDAATRRFFAWRARHPHEAEDPSAIWAAAWRAGGRDALLRSSELADLVPRLEELAALFWSGRIESDIAAEAAGGSAYWSSEAT